MKRSVQIFIFLWTLGAVSNSWALGIPGFPQLNTAIGGLCAIFVGIVEAYLIVQLIFHMALLHKGQPGEKEKVFMLSVAIFLVPWVPSIGNFLYEQFFQNGGTQNESGFWTGN